MRHRRPAKPREARGVSLMVVWTLALAAALATGCGDPAKRDFDLNTGQALDDERQEELASLFLGPEEGDEEPTYTVTEGDKLEIVFFTHPEQNRFVTVRPDGRITLPYVGDVVAVGKTPPALAAELQEAYQTVLIKPRVDVLVQEMGAPYYVLGEVAKPGEYTYERRVNILQAVAKAGGYVNGSRLSTFVVLRRTPDATGAVAAIFDMRQYMADPETFSNVRIRPYDIVWVPKDALSRWDDSTSKLFSGILDAQQVIIRGWSLVNFNKVYARGVTNPQ
jgi:polysaccharide export outer membrane protein